MASFENQASADIQYYYGEMLQSSVDLKISACCRWKPCHPTSAGIGWMLLITLARPRPE